MATLSGKRPKNYKYVIVDGINLVARNHHGLSLSYNGENTGGIYGVLRFVLSINNLYPAARIVFLWEGKNSQRKEENKQYKADRVRDKGDSEFIDRIRDIEYILPRIQVDQIRQEGMEADDIAAYFSDRATEDNKVLLVSTDWDWWEFAHDNAHIQYRKSIIGVDDMRRRFAKKYNLVQEQLEGVIPDKMSMWKALVGGHDNLKGVPRIPKKLVIGALARSNTISDVPYRLHQLGHAAWAEKVKNHMWLVKDNFSISVDRRDRVDPSKFEYYAGVKSPGVKLFLLEKGMKDFVEYFEWT